MAVRLAVTLGDPRGIGPEIVARALADDAVRARCALVLVGPEGWGDDVQPSVPGVHVLGAVLPGDLHAAYAGATAFCYPSFREGFGLPVLEAMAHGVPVVTSVGTPMAELVDDSGAGVLVDPADPAAIAAGLRTVLDDEGTMARAARRRARDYTWGHAAERTVAAYRDAMTRH